MRVEVTGRAAPALVWDRFTRPALWSTWAPHIRSVVCADARIRRGSTGVVRGPWPIRIGFVVDDVDSGTLRWTWTVGRLVRMEHGVEPSGTGARVWVRLPTALAVPYLPLLRLALRRLAG